MVVWVGATETSPLISYAVVCFGETEPTFEMLTDGPDVTVPMVMVESDHESFALSPLMTDDLSDESDGVLQVGARGMLRGLQNEPMHTPPPLPDDPDDEAVTVTVLEAVADFPPPEHVTL